MHVVQHGMFATRAAWTAFGYDLTLKWNFLEPIGIHWDPHQNPPALPLNFKTGGKVSQNQQEPIGTHIGTQQLYHLKLEMQLF